MIVDVRRIATWASIVALAAIGWTMLHDGAELDARAADVACRGYACNAALKKRTRNLFGWTFAFMTYGQETTTVDVTCTRELWVFGDYRCDVTEVGSAPDGRFEQR